MIVSKTSNHDRYSAMFFGGGSVVPELILSELEDIHYDITTVTSMVDSGGSSGRFRREFDVLPPGDIRRHLLALSTAPEWKKKLWEFRFGNIDGCSEHSFGNSLIAGLENIYGDFEKTIQIVHDFLEVKGRCLPATLDKVDLVSVFEDGSVVRGEHNIDEPSDRDPDLGIQEVKTEPKASAYGPVLEAIEKSDLMVIGPGDLYTSIIPCFLPDGYKEALAESDAIKIFIVPLLTKKGETLGMSVTDMVEELEKYMGIKLDFVICNKEVPSNVLRRHRKESPHLIEPVKVDVDTENSKYIIENLLDDSGYAVHDSHKLLGVVNKLFRDNRNSNNKSVVSNFYSNESKN